MPAGMFFQQERIHFRQTLALYGELVKSRGGGNSTFFSVIPEQFCFFDYDNHVKMRRAKRRLLSQRSSGRIFARHGKNLTALSADISSGNLRLAGKRRKITVILAGGDWQDFSCVPWAFGLC
ncbi:hypothetical protein [uncultured Mailhella sp.]|uniref:hypothetical protein n=1 Tax=uncultured Mailhella sp. TaxID=1981031 RepID=UPI0025EF9F66|nr:hypothetical protein [uncultured Mailhella sp.]